MDIEEHLASEFAKYGTRTPRIHLELDQLFKEYGPAHRKHRHHLEYVLNKWARGEWSPHEVRVAILHIMDDCNGMLMTQDDWCDYIDFYDEDK